jgi:hypothetical protein
MTHDKLRAACSAGLRREFVLMMDMPVPLPPWGQRGGFG